MNTIRTVREFKGFPCSERDVKDSRIAGCAVCELTRLREGGGAGAPSHVSWRIVDVQFDAANQQRLGLDFGRNQPLQDRFVAWFRTHHGMAVAAALHALATQPRKRTVND